MSIGSATPCELPRHAVLFVDDEPKVLLALERMLRPLKDEWRMMFVSSGDEALEALERERFDVVVTDMRMPGMNGVQLMERVAERHAPVVRMALSGHSDRELILRAVHLAHQYLSKPCDGAVLKEKLAQAMRLRQFTDNPALQAIAARVDTLRAVPSLYMQVMAELQHPSPSVARVAQLIATDPAMTAKVLQLINSAFFGLRAHISDPARAVQLLGLDTVKALVLSVQVFSQFEANGRTSPAGVWTHALSTARIADLIARDLALESHAIHEAFTAGLLHDVGKLVMSEALPDYDATMRESPRDGSRLDVERTAFGATHAEVGAYLFGLWGLPYGIVEAIAWHHRPGESGIPGRCPLTALHAANAIEHARHGGAAARPQVDDNYLAALGLTGACSEWHRRVIDADAAHTAA